ncbi:12492_t:CDS:2 [Acaulospora colombiana]|uniref:12492_t:CDS:1 n=1 Tax=Acaulospora colombiana TaxID=27376 RepID=A0ACA9KQL4_9GLOM|nr:12492_t:CDS:2 [Acaulospora colombiana]
MKTQISKTVDSVGTIEMESGISDSASDYKDSQMENEYDAATNRKKCDSSLPDILAVLSIIVVVDPNAGQEDAYNQVISTQLGNEIGLGGLVSALIAVSSIGAVGSMVWSGSRIIAAAATKDYIPFCSPKLRNFHKKYYTPFNALIFQWIYCSFIVLFFPSNNPYDALTNMAQYSSLIFYGLSALGLLKNRENSTSSIQDG